MMGHVAGIDDEIEFRCERSGLLDRL